MLLGKAPGPTATAQPGDDADGEPSAWHAGAAGHGWSAGHVGAADAAYDDAGPPHASAAAAELHAADAAAAADAGHPPDAWQPAGMPLSSHPECEACASEKHAISHPNHVEQLLHGVCIRLG